MSLETQNIIIGRERNETQKSKFFTNRTFKGHVSFFNLSFHSDLTRLVLCTLKNNLLDLQTSYMLFMAQCKRVSPVTTLRSFSECPPGEWAWRSYRPK